MQWINGCGKHKHKGDYNSVKTSDKGCDRCSYHNCDADEAWSERREIHAVQTSKIGSYATFAILTGWRARLTFERTVVRTSVQIEMICGAPRAWCSRGVRSLVQSHNCFSNC